MSKTIIISFIIAFLMHPPVYTLTGNTESIYIHTDRDFYIAGERIYFRLNVLNNHDGPASSIAYLMLRNSDNTIVERLYIYLEGGNGYGSLYIPDTLGTSVYQLVAFTNLMRNFGQENYAYKQIVVVNRFDEEPVGKLSQVSDRSAAPIITGPDEPAMAGNPVQSSLEVPGDESTDSSILLRGLKSVYGTREKVYAEISLSGHSGTIVSLSVSIAQKESLLPDQPGYSSPAGRNNHLLRHSFEYIRETDGPVISGRLVHNDSGAAIDNALIILNTPDTAVNLIYARTLDNGQFHFNLNEYHSGKDLYISVYDNPISKKADLSIDDKFSSQHQFIPEDLEEIPAEYIRKSQDIVRINKTMNIDHVKQIQPERQGYLPAIYSAPPWSISSLSDYEFLDDLHEIARELIPFLRIRRQGDLFTSTLVLYISDLVLLESPVYFLDGIYQDDINRLISLNSKDLRSIELNYYKWRHGELTFPGIVALFSNNKSFTRLPATGHSLIYEHRSAAPLSYYPTPDYEKEKIERARPDFRQLLFWNPEILIGKNNRSKTIEFFTGDLEGEYTIRIKGITEEGEIISVNSGFKVSRKDSLIDSTLTEVKTAPGTEICEQAGISTMDDLKVMTTEKHDIYFQQDLSGMINQPPRRTRGDQHYPSEEWLRADVRLVNGLTVRDRLVRYNGYLDELFWVTDEDFQIVQLDRELVNEFRLTRKVHTGPPAVFRRISVNLPVYTVKDEIFGELLHEGHISLYAYRRVIKTTRSDFKIGEKVYGGDLVVPSHLYIFNFPDGSNRVIRKISRNKVSGLFHENRKEINNLLRNNRLRPRNENDLIKTIILINKFLTAE